MRRVTENFATHPAEDLRIINGMDSPDGRNGANPATATFLF